MEIVIGDKDAKLKYFKSKGVDTSQIEAEDGKKKDDSTSKKIIIDVDSAEPLTEEELRMLTRTRNRHDPHEVYMQSDVSFYDAFYSSSDDLDGELSEEAHRIRRVYKNYKEYLMAMDIRDQYIEMLLDEKFGGDVEKFKLTMGLENPPYWVPPMPICTRSARKKATVGNRYDPYGIMTPVNFVPDEKSCKRAMEVLAQDRINAIGECDADRGEEHVSVYTDVCTDYRVIQDVNENFNESTSSSGSGGYRDNLQSQFDDIIKGWYQDEKKLDEKKESRAFYYSEDAIRERYLREGYECLPKDLDKIMFDPNYIPEDEREDWDETVYDPGTGRAMSKQEAYKRNLIRTLSKIGYNDLHLMEVLDVGTRVERARKVRSQAQLARSKYKCKPETIAMREQMQSGDYYGSYGGYGDYDEFGDDDNSSYNFFDDLDKALKGER